MSNIIEFPTQNKIPLPKDLIDKGIEVGFTVEEISEITQALIGEIESKEPQKYVPAYCDPDNEIVGSEYAKTKDLDIKEIAKLVRADIKEEIKNGKLPNGLKTSVRIERFSMGQALNISVKNLGNDFQLFSDGAIKNLKEFGQAQIAFDPYDENFTVKYSIETNDVLQKLKEIQQRYNRDNSDSMTDYFDVHFYGGVDIDWKYEKEEKERYVNE